MKAKENLPQAKTFKGMMLLVLLFAIIITAVVTYSITKRKTDNIFNPDLYNAGVQMEILKMEIIKKDDSLQVLRDSIARLNKR